MYEYCKKNFLLLFLVFLFCLVLLFRCSCKPLNSNFIIINVIFSQLKEKISNIKYE